MTSTKPVFSLPVSADLATKSGLDAEVNRVVDLLWPMAPDGPAGVLDEVNQALVDVEAQVALAAVYNQGPLLDRAVTVIEDTSITYASFAAGDIVRLRAQPWAYDLKPAAASEFDLITTGGAKLDLTDRSQWGAWGAPADAAIEHNPNGANVYLGYVVTGTDCAATLQKAINRAIADNVGALDLPPGAWLVDADIDLTGPENTNFAGQMFGLRGAGISHPSWIQYGLGRRQGSVLLLKAGRKIIKGRPGQRMRDLTIIGKVESGVLLDLVEASTTGGGLDHVAVVNNIPSSPVGSPVAVRVTGLWMGGLDHVEIMGRRDYRAAWDDTGITGDNLFYGTGLFVDVRTQGGSTGGPEKTTAAGCAIGLRIAAPEQQIWYSLDSTTFRDWQSQYCKVGALIERGASVVIFESPHFEYCGDADLIVRNGAGHVAVRNGKSALTLRGAEYRKYGSMVCGSPVSGENKFKSLHVEGFTFETLENSKCAVRYYGGATEAPGLLILEDCTFAGGGIAVLVDTTLGSICDIWIKGSKPHPLNYSSAYSDTSASRLIVTATGETDRGALTSGLTDRNWLGRIEGVAYNLGQAGANNAALDFTGRKVIPWAIIPSSAANGQDLTITLSPSVLPGQDMIVSKQFAGGKVSITVPSGSNLFDRSHTKTVGAATVEISGAVVDRWTLRKVSATDWVIE